MSFRKNVQKMSAAITKNLPKSGGLILGKKSTKCATLPKRRKVLAKRKPTADMSYL